MLLYVRASQRLLTLSTHRYGASKAGLASWTKAARYHYRNTQIRLVEIAPPAVKSNLGGSHDYGEDCDEFCDHVFKRFAAGESSPREHRPYA